jgi:signal transduction histidine kinase/CheY-like chemotaxis protein
VERVPNDSSPPVTTGPPSEPAQSAWATGMRLLIVEDEGIIALDLERRLRRLGFATIEVADRGDVALRHFETVGADLVLMDVNIRGPFDGIETAARLSALDDVPIVFLTAYADDRTVSRAAAVSAYGYLLKPVDDTSLVTTLRVASERHARDTMSRLLGVAVASAGMGLALADARPEIPRLVYQNEAYSDLNAHCPAVTVERRPCLPASDPLDPAFLDYRQTMMARRSGHWMIACTGPQGESRICSVSLSPVQDRRGRISHLIVFQRDVTREQEAFKALVESQRLELVARITAGIAHDFGNLLGVIIGFTEVAIDEFDPEQRKNDLEQVMAAARRGSALTRKLLDFSRRADIRSEGFADLNAVIEGARPIMSRFVGPHIYLEVEAPPAAATVALDPTSLEQILFNLVVNARDAMPNGGALKIRTSTRSGLAGDVIRLEVEDTGMGMDASVQARLFEPLFTTKPKGKGTGLGLSTSAQLVEQAGGTIRVDSVPGAGSTFIVEFPVLGSTAFEPEPAQPEGSIRTRCLLVLNDPALVEVYRRGLHGLGWIVDVPHAPVSARALEPSEDSERVVVICDANTPAADGCWLEDLARDAAPAPRVVLLTASPEARKSPPGWAMLSKPVTLSRLLIATREVLRGNPAETEGRIDGDS